MPNFAALLAGFHLINVGFVSLALRNGTKPPDIVGVFEYLSTKVGLVVMMLGFMHFLPTCDYCHLRLETLHFCRTLEIKTSMGIARHTRPSTPSTVVTQSTAALSPKIESSTPTISGPKIE